MSAEPRERLTFSIPKNLSLPSFRIGAAALLNIFSSDVSGGAAASRFAGDDVEFGFAPPCYEHISTPDAPYRHCTNRTLQLAEERRHLEGASTWNRSSWEVVVRPAGSLVGERGEGRCGSIGRNQRRSLRNGRALEKEQYTE